MDPSRNYNFYPHYNSTNQPQNPNMQPPNPNLQRPEYAQNTGMQPNFGGQYAIPPNFGMQYPYMPYGFPPISGSSYVPSPINYPNTEQNNTPNVSSGYIPDFSTQVSLGNIDEDSPSSFVAETQLPTKKKSYDYWTTEENVALLTGFFHVSEDPELGNNQKSETFWGKIADFVVENCSSRKTEEHMLNAKVNKFVGFYSASLRDTRSGWNEEKYISRAVEMYREEFNAEFKLLEVWRAVRYHPKFMTCVTEESSSGTKRKSGSDSVESSMNSISCAEGREATKKKAKASSSRRKAKVDVQAELANLTTFRVSFEQGLHESNKNMAEYTRQSQVETAFQLSILRERNDFQEAMLEDLKKKLGYP